MKNRYWEAIHEVYTRLETLCSRSLSGTWNSLGHGSSSGEGNASIQENLSAEEGAAIRGDAGPNAGDVEPLSTGCGDIVHIRAEIRTQLDFLKATLSEQYSERDTYLILFPVVAHIDELILTTYLHAMKTSWPPLQKELFQIDNAGEVFYEILDDILLKPQTPLFIFEVYYFCLSYGFRGRYQDNPVKVKEYMKHLDIKLEQDELKRSSSADDESGLVTHFGSPYLSYLFPAGGLLMVYLLFVIAGRQM